MDYKTRPTTRIELRRLAKVFDLLVGTENVIYKPVVHLLDRLTDIMPFVRYEIVEDDAFEVNVPARGYFQNDGIYLIEIKEYVYNGAADGVGAHRDIIMHEIFHPFMLIMGFWPVYERRFADAELPSYESGEWQVKAITGEYMMEYESTAMMTTEEIVKNCGVSRSSAFKRRKY